MRSSVRLAAQDKSFKLIPIDSSPVWTIWMAREALPALATSENLGIFALLDAGALDVDAIASRSQISQRAALVLLRQLTSLRLLTETGGRYQLNDTSRTYLLPNATDGFWLNTLHAAVENEPTSFTEFEREIAAERSAYYRPDLSRRRHANEQPLIDIFRSNFSFPTLYLSAKSGLFRRLAANPLPLATAKPLLNANETRAQALIDELRDLGLITFSAHEVTLTELGRTYAVTPETSEQYNEYQRQYPYNWGGIIKMMSENPIRVRRLLGNENPETTKRLSHLARHDRPFAPDSQMMDFVLGTSEQATTFGRHMHSQGAAAAVKVAQSAAFAGAHRVLDVAGGIGTYAVELAAQRPDLERVTILELSRQMIELGRDLARRTGVAERVLPHHGNMFNEHSWAVGPAERDANQLSPLPVQHDRVFFSYIFHDWALPENLMLARLAHQHLPVGGKIVVHDIFTNAAGFGPPIADAFSMTLFLWTSGRHYKISEIRALLTTAGFSDITVEDGHGPSKIVSAVKT